MKYYLHAYSTAAKHAVERSRGMCSSSSRGEAPEGGRGGQWTCPDQAHT